MSVSPSPITATSPSVPKFAAPAWFNELQQQAWKEYTATNMPSRKNEAWRFSDLEKVNFDTFFAPEALSDVKIAELVAKSIGLQRSIGRIIFINDELVHLDEDLERSGVQVLPLERGLAQAKNPLNALSARLGSEKFVALHQSHLRNATVISVPKNFEAELPLEIYHWASGAQVSCFPRTIVLAEDHSRLSILEHHLSDGDEAQFSCGATQIHASRGSQVNYLLCQRRNLAAKSLHMTSSHCGRDAKVLHCQVNLGCAWSRSECVSHLEGEGGRSDMLSISLTDNDQEMDQRTLQLHHAPRAQSDLLYKNVLFGKSRNIFAGLIVVDDGAHYTDAYQTCRNLLMTDECEANAMPGLEINADQVKCSHGSTSGAISPEELFYFESRGIPESAARALLAQGFLAQTLERLEDDVLREFLLHRVAERFAAALNSIG